MLNSYQMETLDRKYSCPVEVTIEAIGGKWKCVILWWLRRDARRFGELKLLIPTISQKVLTQQLRELETDGLITRQSYRESPPRVEYFLTPHGQTLTPITELMCEWGKHHKVNHQFGGCRLDNVRVLVLSQTRSLHLILEEYSATVVSATSVFEMLTLFDGYYPDVLLVDFSILDETNSQLFIAKIKQMQQLSRSAMPITEDSAIIPPALTTQFTMVATVPIDNYYERGRAFKMGFAVHLPSPIDTAEMIATLSSVTRRTA
jgi:DNA-binding HxlR family transcriptional regulator/CheY-like chemotaxis protein